MDSERRQLPPRPGFVLGIRTRGNQRGIAMMALTLETKTGWQIGPYPEESDGGQVFFNARCTVRNIIGIMAVALVGCSTVSDAQQAAPVPQEQSAPLAGPPPASNGLSGPDAPTFLFV